MDDIEGAAAETKQKHRLYVFNCLQYIELSHQKSENKADKNRVLGDFTSLTSNSLEELEPALLVKFFVTLFRLFCFFNKVRRSV